MRTAVIVLALLLAGCASSGMPAGGSAALVGPVVEGKMPGATENSYIPYSATGGSPIIATEAYAFPRVGASITAPIAITSIKAGNKLWLSKYTSGTGHTDAPKDLSADSQYVTIGGREYGLASYRGIGFGYVGAASEIAPVFAGIAERNTTGSTNGDFVIATRSATTNTAPSVRLSVTNVGQIISADDYAPSTAMSLTTKKYVDGLIAELQSKIDALPKP